MSESVPIPNFGIEYSIPDSDSGRPKLERDVKQSFYCWTAARIAAPVSCGLGSKFFVFGFDFAI